VTRYPYHRYLAYQLLNGDDVDAVISHMRDLEFIAPRRPDVEKLSADISRSHLAGENLRQAMRLEFFDDAGPSLEAMFWLVETMSARSVAERMLLDRVDTKTVAAVLAHKFDVRVSVDAVEKFRDGFWDTVTLSPVDFAEYFHIGGRRKPDPPPTRVPLNQRPSYVSWSEGVVPDDDSLSVEDMIRNIAVDSYFQFKELSSRPDVDSKRQALSFAGMVLKTAPTALRKTRKNEAPPPLAPLLEYPQDTVPTVEELDNDVDDSD
jgi:hypothetical protein